MNETQSFTLELTKDELTILKYVIPRDSWGDPLKDTYELREDEPEEPYKVLATLNEKVNALQWEVEEPATVTLHEGSWHDGPGWYYTLDELPDEGSCGAFKTREEAIEHARGCGYAVKP